MKACTEYLTFTTSKKIEFINITPNVEEIVKKSGIKEGLCLINSMHITSSVFVNDEENGLKQDFKDWLEKIAPTDINKYRHNLTGED
ncbi:MAG: YjbQ family protein, partial [Candidatus Omnitrophica bacterium]|nr:YjbQ family protein [Candidatus Omnitrophota bacterium]